MREAHELRRRAPKPMANLAPGPPKCGALRALPFACAEFSDAPPRSDFPREQEDTKSWIEGAVSRTPSARAMAIMSVRTRTDRLTPE